MYAHTLTITGTPRAEVMRSNVTPTYPLFQFAATKLFLHVRAYIHTCARDQTHAHSRRDTYVSVWVCGCVCTYLFVYVYVCVHVYMYVCGRDINCVRVYVY